MMKKLFVCLCISLACCLAQPVKAQMVRFYYYPKNNVYYNVSSKEYIYNRQGSWTPVADLPDELEVSGSPRVVMYSMKPDVWTMNDEHQELYRNYVPERRVGKLFGLKKDGEKKK